MAVTPDDPRRLPIESGELIPPSARRPLLPIAEFRPSEPRLTVYFTMNDAIGAARASAGHELIDARGVVLTLVDVEDIPRLEARGEGDGAELHRRLMVELRSATELAAPDKRAALQAEIVLNWLEAAPTAEHALHALSLAPLDYAIEGLNDSSSCQSCTWFQKLLRRTPPCCPG